MGVFVTDPEPTPALETLRPRRLGPAEKRYEGKRTTCRVHGKPKCPKCEGARKSTVRECCALHHQDDDGLPVRACEEHRMTSCGPCKSVAQCCKSWHHACKAHGLPTCGECANTKARPNQCCRRGHHDKPRGQAAHDPGEYHLPTPPDSDRSDPQPPVPPKRRAKRTLSCSPKVTKRSKTFGRDSSYSTEGVPLHTLNLDPKSHTADPSRRAPRPRVPPKACKRARSSVRSGPSGQSPGTKRTKPLRRTPEIERETKRMRGDEGKKAIGRKKSKNERNGPSEGVT